MVVLFLLSIIHRIENKFSLIIILFLFKIFSYLGKGVVPAAPKTVFEAVRNPQTRFTYDEMLKVLFCY